MISVLSINIPTITIIVFDQYRVSGGSGGSGGEGTNGGALSYRVNFVIMS